MGAKALRLALPPWVVVVGAIGVAGAEVAPVPGECGPVGGATRCVYRSGLPSTGLVSVCRGGDDCRLGYYYGGLDDVTWFPPPPGVAALARPEVAWLGATLAHARIPRGAAGGWSYFFDARRRRLSAPRADVVAIDAARLLIAAVEDGALVARQMFSDRTVLRIERDFAPGPVAAAVAEARFDPDGRLTFTWLRGERRERVTERVSVPPVPRR